MAVGSEGGAATDRSGRPSCSPSETTTSASSIGALLASDATSADDGSTEESVGMFGGRERALTSQRPS
eukprot:1384880-Rhodomonas_salina.1